MRLILPFESCQKDLVSMLSSSGSGAKYSLLRENIMWWVSIEPPTVIEDGGGLRGDDQDDEEEV